MLRIHQRPAILSAAGLVICSTFTTAVHPDDDTSLAERQWEEVVVVANQLPRPARETGSAVTVLDAGDIRDRQLELASDLLREVPGVAVNRSGQVGNVTQVRMRGAEGNHTLVLIDGIEANDPGFGSEFNFANLLTYDIDRVEVLRGPQSALYGSDAIGGVISIETTPPRPGLHAHAQAQAGSFGTRQVGASVTAGSGAVAGHVSAARYDTDGISASAIAPEKDGFDTETVHSKLTVAVSPRLRARLVFRRSDNEVETDRQDFDFPSTPTEGLVVDANETTRSRQRYARAEVEAALADGRWLHTAAVGYTDTATDNVADGSRVGGNRGERRSFDYHTTLRLDTGRWNHALTGGVQRELLDFRVISSATPGANQRRRDQQTSYVAEYALTGDPGLAASVSVRHDDNDRFADATTFRATGSWLLNASATRFHASYGQGITNPSFVELFGFLPSSFRGNPDLEPEASTGYDAGVAQSLFGGRALLDATWFEATLSDEISTVFDFATFTSTAVNQRGDSDRHGVEVTLTAQPAPRWRLEGSYTWLDATEPDGRREVRRPRHSGSINVNYAFAGGRGNVNLGAAYNGRQQDAEFVSSTPETRVTLGDYTLVSAAVTFDVNDHLEVFARGENLLDESYTEVFGYRSPGAAGYLGLRARL